MKQPEAIVCARADADKCVRGTTFDRICATCKSPLMLAPSGQRFLSEHPDAVTICMYCIPESAECIGPIRPLEEILEELKGSVPNLRRNRN